jgi:hypothetical protein
MLSEEIILKLDKLLLAIIKQYFDEFDEAEK